MVLARLSRGVLATLVLLAGGATPDLACAEHAQGATPATQPVEHGEGEHHESGPAAPAEPCERPDLPPCCPVLMSCGFVLSAVEASAGPREGDASTVPLLRHSRPALSRITAPDPPPPRS